MKRIRTGVAAGRNKVVLKQPEGGMRRLRCPKCQQLAAPAVRSNGAEVYRCACGVEYSVRVL